MERRLAGLEVKSPAQRKFLVVLGSLQQLNVHHSAVAYNYQLCDDVLRFGLPVVMMYFGLVYQYVDRDKITAIAGPRSPRSQVSGTRKRCTRDKPTL